MGFSRITRKYYGSYFFDPTSRCLHGSWNVFNFSDEGLGFNSWDSTEIILDFNLPEGSIVYDSWLWMFDDTTIVRADIHDIWTATTIYENIVDRRRDPSVLFRKASGSYQIRVYPLPNDETRKIKISYLVPAVWSTEEVNAWLPTDILQTSAIPLNYFEIITFPNATWQNPRLNGIPDVDFQSVTDPNYGEILTAQIPSAYINKPFSFAVDAPFNSDGVFVQQFDNGTDKFYQAAYLPPEIPTPANTKKIVFLVDHEDVNSSIDKADFYQYLEAECKTYLKSEDQFNFIFSNTSNPQMMSENWILGNPDSITQAFSQMAAPIKNYSDLVELLENGINFLIGNGDEEGDIILLVNSDNITWDNN
ncbi:MAG: Ca-activated chloride channel family protein [Granulosicoccus sp.]